MGQEQQQPQQPQLSEVMAALKNADAAGDVEGAKKLATLAQQLQEQQEPKASTQKPIDIMASRLADEMAAARGSGDEARVQYLQQQQDSLMKQGAVIPEGAGPARRIGQGAGTGAIAGAFAPEIVSGLGFLTMGGGVAFPPAAPVLEPAGAWLVGAGRAMRGARMMSAAYGALSGAVGTTAQIGAEELGAGKKTAAAIGFAASLATPSSVGLLKDFAVKGGGMAVQFAQRMFPVKQAGEVVVDSLARKQAEALVKSGMASHDTYAAIGAGLQHEAIAAQAAGKQWMADAYKKAAAALEVAPGKSQKIINEAQGRVANMQNIVRKRAEVVEASMGKHIQQAQIVNARAEGELAKLAPQKELSEIGGELRQVVMQRNQAMLGQRAAEYDKLKQGVMQTVAGKEKQGQFLIQTPEMVALKQEIEKKLLLTAYGRKMAAGKAEVTEPGVKSVYDKVYQSITDQVVDGKKYKSTFEAVDHVRRKLGDVIGGKPVEGYDAIGKNIAQDLYAKLSAAQERFAGPAFKEMQTAYAEATGQLAAAGGKRGQTVLAADRVNLEAMANDAKDLPATFFTSKQGVQDLLELSGNVGLVQKSAKEYAVNNMAGMTQKQVAAWMKKNSDWIAAIPAKEVPGKLPGQMEKVTFRSELEGYVSRLGKIEEDAARSLKIGQEMGKEAKNLRTEAQAVGTKTMAEAEIKAAQARAASMKMKKRMGAGVAGAVAQAGSAGEIGLEDRLRGVVDE